MGSISNYTTKVDFLKTCGEIQTMLGRNGAKCVLTTFDNAGLPVAIAFQLDFNGQPVSFQLPCNYEGVLKVLKASKISGTFKTKEQALRVSWRIVRDWVEVQIAMHTAKLASMEELFFQYAQLPNGKTIFNEFQSGGYKLLTGDSKPVMP